MQSLDIPSPLIPGVVRRSHIKTCLKVQTEVRLEKLRFCGKQAARKGLQYFWTDSCCIKKASNAVLSESLTHTLYCLPVGKVHTISRTFDRAV